MNTENTTESQELIVREKIPNSPFTVVGNETVGYFITMGEYRLTEHFETTEQASKQLEIDRWNIIARLIAATLDKYDTLTKQN